MRHCNNLDVWVLSHEYDSNGFRAYLITAEGINLVPVISNAGTVELGATANAIGYMKISPDGNKLALAVRQIFFSGGPGYIELFDFNNNTGVVLVYMQYASGVD